MKHGAQLSIPRERLICIAVLSAIALTPLLVAAVGLQLWVDAIKVRDMQIEGDLDKLDRYQGLVATLPLLRKALQEARANDAFRDLYFDAPTQAIAGAQLQSEIQEIIRAAGARPISAQVLPGDRNDNPPRVRARIQLQGSTAQLQAVLHRVESARPFLIVDQMSIRSQSRAVPQVARRRRGMLGGNDSQQGSLTVRLDVFGYFYRPS